MAILAWSYRLPISFQHDERGNSFVEYVLLLCLIVVLALVAVQAFGENVSAKFSEVSTQF